MWGNRGSRLAQVTQPISPMSPQGLSAFFWAQSVNQNVWRSPAKLCPELPTPPSRQFWSLEETLTPRSQLSLIRRAVNPHGTGLPLSQFRQSSALFSPSLVWSTMLSTFQEFPQWSFTSSVTAGRQQPLNARSQHNHKTQKEVGRAPFGFFLSWQLSIRHPQVKAALAGSGGRGMSRWHGMGC